MQETWRKRLALLSLRTSCSPCAQVWSPRRRGCTFIEQNIILCCSISFLSKTRLSLICTASGPPSSPSQVPPASPKDLAHMALGGMRRGLLRSWHSEWLKICGKKILRNGGLCKCWQRYLDADPLELLRELHYLPWCYLRKTDFIFWRKLLIFLSKSKFVT